MPSSRHLFRDAARRLNPQSLVPLLIVLVLAPIAIPFTRSGFPQGHDTAAHLANLFRFDRAWSEGQLPVRWAEGLAAGFGQPLFNFYQVGFYYLVSGLRALGLPLSAAFKSAPVLLCWAGALFTWLWLRPWGAMAAGAGAVTFGLSPYVLTDLFVRAAYPELTAIVFVVGTLWTGDAFMRDGRARYLAAFAVLVGLTLLSHLPAALIAGPLVAAQMAARAFGAPHARSRGAMLLTGAALGAGLASFYVLPALWEIGQVSMGRLTSGGADYRRHFVPAHLWAPHVGAADWNAAGSTVTDPADLLPVHVSVVQWAALIGGALLLAARPWRSGERSVAACVAAYTAIAVYALFMMHAASSSVWAAVPALAFIQFPWRFFLLISIAAAGLTAVLLSRIRSPRWRAAAVVFVVALQLQLSGSHLRPAGVIPRAEMNIDDPGWMVRAVRAGRMFAERGYDPRGTMPLPGLPARWTLTGRADVEVLEDAGTRLALRVAASGSPVELRLNVPMFPGWDVRIDDRPATVSRTDNGYMRVTVPDGRHVVRARFRNTSVRTVANALSVGSLLLIVAGAAIRRRW